MAITPQKQASSIWIRELSGLNRRIELSGSALPKQGANWGGEQRVVTTWYPGNSTQATQQILGPIERDTNWEGVWRTTQLIRTPAHYFDETSTGHYISNAFTLREVLEDIFRGGQTLSVEWTDGLRNLNRRIVREGVAKEWDFSYDRADDISWKIVWDWSGRGGQQQKAVAFRNDTVASLQSITLSANEFADWAEALDHIETRKKGKAFVTKFSLGQLENLVNGPYEFTRSITRKLQQVTDRLKKVGDLIIKVRAVPYQLTNLGLDLANNTIAISNQFIDEMSRKPPELMASRTKLSNLTKAGSYYGGGITQAALIRRSAQGVKTQLQNQSKSQATILAVHVVRDETESLLTMSKHYYKTPDFAPGIARANRLPLNQQFAERGDILIIPTVDVIKGFHLTNG